jgi:hypothetical protein
MKKKRNILATSVLLATLSLLLVSGLHAQGGHPPDHEPAYFGGQVYAMTASDWLPQKAPAKVQSNIFVVVYPIGWASLGLDAPQCNPCDHAGNGIGFDDFHDHVLDSIPGTAGWSPLRRVNVILPNYSFLAGINDPARDAAVSAAYASQMPATSTDALNDLLNSTAPDGSPLAIRIDAGFYIRATVTPLSN